MFQKRITMNKTIFLSIALQLAGVIVIILEIIIPSAGLLSIAALCLFGYSLFLVFTHASITMGIILTTADAAIIPILVIMGLKMLAKSPLTLHKKLSSSNGVTSQSKDLEKLIGKKGTVHTDLRPSGSALIDKKKIDVVSRGEYIEANAAIIVHAVTGNQVIVKKEYS